MKTIRTINKEIEAKGFSILADFGFSRINGYFNFHTSHSSNTFIFREFVENQRKSFLEALTNRDFILALDGYKVIAYRSFKDTSFDPFMKEILEKDYNDYLDQYRN